jgi:hypothetical protein
MFEKVVNEDIILEKRDNKHLFTESDLPKKWEKSNFFEARNCYISISIEYQDDNDNYFVQFAKTIDIFGNKKGTLFLDGIYESFIGNTVRTIKRLNDYLIEEGRN